MSSPAPKIVSAAMVLAILAWLLLSLGLLYARLVVSDLPPNVVITFSDKGLARLFVELLCLGIGSLGFLLAVVAFALGARSRSLTLAALGSAAICIVCVTLLI